MEEEKTKDLEEAEGHKVEDFGSYGNKFKLALKTKAGGNYCFELFFDWIEIICIVLVFCFVAFGVTYWFGRKKPVEQQVEEKFEMDPNPIIIEPKEN